MRLIRFLPTVGLILPLAGLAQQTDPLRILQSIVKFEASELLRIRAGEPIAKLVPTTKPGDVFVIGAVHIHANPNRYSALASDFDRLRRNPQYLELRRIASPANPADFEGFEIGPEEWTELQACRPAACDYQIPDNALEEVHKFLAAPGPPEARRLAATAKLRELAARLVQRYQRQGDSALGSYVDKAAPFRISEQFADLASNVTALQHYLPNLNRHLLEFPNFQVPGAKDLFYWEKVKFGMKPTTRINHMTYYGENGAHLVAIKQLYANHYFQVALDISACLPAPQGGFYLINWRGSRQDGLTGFKGAFLRRVVTSKVRSGQAEALAAIKQALERR